MSCFFAQQTKSCTTKHYGQSQMQLVNIYDLVILNESKKIRQFVRTTHQAYELRKVFHIRTACYKMFDT